MDCSKYRTKKMKCMQIVHITNGMIYLAGFSNSKRNFEIPKELKKLLMLLNKLK